MFDGTNLTLTSDSMSNLKTSVNEKLNSDLFFQIDHFIYKAFLYEYIIKIRETV